MDALSDDRILWIFGSPRSGSTWLASMLVELAGAHRVDEPLIGAHLGVSLESVLHSPVEGNRTVMEHVADREGYFFSDDSAPVWKPLLRELIVARLGFGADDLRVVVKEPNGTLMAPLLMELLPGSSMILLARDGRDVVDSMLAAANGGWLSRWTRRTQDDRAGMLVAVAQSWVRSMTAARRAFDSLPKNQRILVTYEALRIDTPRQLKRIGDRFNIGGDIGAVAAKHAIERVDEKDMGETKFLRAASPGLWRERFSAQEIDTLNEIMGPTLAAFSYQV